MKILTSERKYFLFVWIPVIVIVVIGMFGNLNRTSPYRYTVYMNVLTLDKFIPAFLVLGFFSIFLFIVVGLKEVSGIR